MLKDALVHARAARGTDDSANDWLCDAVAGAGSDPNYASTDQQLCEEESPPQDSDNHRDPYEEYEVQDDRDFEIPDRAYDPVSHCVPVSARGFFTLTFRGPMGNHVEVALNATNTNQFFADASEADTIMSILDEVMWRSFAEKLAIMTKEGKIRGSILMHVGTTFNKHFRFPDVYGSTSAAPKDKELVRTETCLALRLLHTIHIMSDARLPWLLIVPHLIGATQSVYQTFRSFTTVAVIVFIIT